MRADNFICTCFDSEEVVHTKYPEARTFIDTLLDLEALVLFNVDATALSKTSAFKGKSFDKIIFMFPHVGLGIKDQDRNIFANQELILNFLKEAKCRLEPEGQIIITCKTGIPYDKWNVKDLGRQSGLIVARSFEFVPLDFPGYSHRRTLGFEEGKSSEDNSEILKNPPRTFIFNDTA
jgi:25S rRNA (uracil2634-N3)-methyltransferase